MLEKGSNGIGCPVEVKEATLRRALGPSIHLPSIDKMRAVGRDPDPGQNRGGMQRPLCEQYLSLFFILLLLEIPSAANSREL